MWLEGPSMMMDRFTSNHLSGWEGWFTPALSFDSVIYFPPGRAPKGRGLAGIIDKSERNISMRLCIKLSLVSLVIAMAAFAAVGQEKKIKRSDLPPAVEKTVAEQSKDATINGFSTEVEKGKRLYEVELTVNGHGKDIAMDGKGNIVEVEEQVSMDSLSPEVLGGLKRAAGAGTITKVESLTKGGKLVAYEAAVKTGTKHSEVQVGPDGKKLTHPE
jgi:hypothetical protein